MWSLRLIRWITAACLLVLATLLLSLDTVPSVAQTAFATNTPSASTVATPIPAIASGPEAPSDQYALRLMLEPDLVALLMETVQQLTLDDEHGRRAVQLVQYELQRRFPGSPSQAAQSEELLKLMLNAPRGSVDMRSLVRSYIKNVLNTQGPVAQAGGFAIELFLVNLDITDPLDVIVHTRYPADAVAEADVIYDGYVLMRVNSAGQYELLPASADFPAAPFGDTQQVNLEYFGDVNNDGRDEMVLSVKTSDLNRRLLIYGLRNEEFLDLVVPGRTLDYGEIINFIPEQGAINVLHYRQESEAWGCIGEIEVNWVYNSNLYRPVVVDLNRHYAPQNSLACRLAAGEPYFSLPPTDAINNIQVALSESSRDEPGSQFALDRAEMMLAMLYALDGQLTAAQDSVTTLQARAETGSWLEAQTTAFTTSLGRANVTAIDICAALMAANTNGACDIDAVLGQIFEANPLSRSRPVVEQLEERGLPVLESRAITEVGRANREAVNFNLFGASWWTFAPLGAETYTAERAAALEGLAASTAGPVAFTEAPAMAYTALLTNDATGALSLVNNAELSNPGVPLAPPARYLQALSYDLLADRRGARNAFYNLWLDFPTTFWAKLAAAHLELH